MKQKNNADGSDQLRRFSKRDAIILALVFAVIVFVFLVFWLRPKTGGSAVRITVDGKVYGTYALEEAQTISIKDKDGKVTNQLVIENETAHMQKADCPDQLCVHQKAVSKENETIVCLPNKVVVEVTQAEEQAEFDAIVN
ncbi:Uncharacterized protein conserved in bacteria [uncultured Roseburia sp.]|uniref:NusG domain II-containing protein n=1 Tax=Brotonthovivens ammoniilytica TaxID=2981725 RepID=A0ABT2TGH9_9FIRM|nr:NusG domain II-containing protein [Brotonthovivens ammoniilytica]MCU6761303.1 NusG domain II-containing protein [Brotonthovivens ammoniilytica]SCI24725.1 Uncharacterized protein conserved in bacteria [uncultured Roseburia sp.]